MSDRAVGCVTLSMLTGFGVSFQTRADENALPPPNATKLLTANLPGSWTFESEPTQLVIRPGKEPVFVNLVGASARLPDETPDEYYRRHTIKRDYQITVRFGPKLTPVQVQQMVNENVTSHRRLQSMTQSPLVKSGKGVVFSPTLTPYTNDTANVR